MFGELTGKLEDFFRKLRGRGKLTEEDVKSALREVRRILLEADVHFGVARDFLKRVESRAVGEEVIKSVTPAQQVIRIINDELVELLGGRWRPLRRSKRPPTTILMVGLQGSGKTTTAGKLGLHLAKRGMRPLLAACDLRRPAAVNQLEQVGEQAEIPVVTGRDSTPLKIALEAKKRARSEGYDTVIVDTAGRLHIDEELMNELGELERELRPAEVLFIADGMTGQDAVNSAKGFSERLGITGVILTKLDGDARGGAALSVREITGKPIRFVGVGEKLDALEEFHPERMAGRILGLGDVVTLVEKAEQAVDREQAEKLAKKLKHRRFDLEDFLDQLRQISKMGSLEGLVKMIPGANKALKGAEVDEGEMKRSEAIILSMTPAERRSPQIIDGSRRRRIAGGSGTTIQDVNRLLNQFEQMQKMFRKIGSKGAALLTGFQMPPS